MAKSNWHPVHLFYQSVIEDVIGDVQDLLLDEGVDELVLQELRTLWENRLMHSRAVEGFQTEEQRQILQSQQQARIQQIIIPTAQQAAPQQPVIVQDARILQHRNPAGMNSATTATLALPTGPYQQLIPSQGKILQLVRGADGTQYLIQPQQQVVLQQQVLPAVPSGGAQAPVIQQVLTALPGVITQQTGVVIQPQQIVISGNNVPQNAQVVQAAQTGLGAVHGEPQSQWWQQQQQQHLKENDSEEDGGWTS